MNINTDKKVTRRHMFKLGVGAVGTLVATRSLAEMCDITTAKQPLGPFFPRKNTPVDPVREDKNPETPIHMANDSDLTFVRGRKGVAKGQVVTISGRVLDSDCNPIPDALLVIWQASSSGRYNHKGDAGNTDFEHPETKEMIQRSLDPSFQYWGRSESGKKGEYQFRSIVPGFYPADLRRGWFRPPHIHVMVSAKGRSQFVTQLYFRGKDILENDFIQKLNDEDDLLQDKKISEEQRSRLIVDFERDKERPKDLSLYGTFDIILPEE